MKYKPTQAEKTLFKAILSLQSLDECQNFLRDLLTKAELKEFANRWKVAQMLAKKTDYKKIEKETGMSSTTIARISKWLTTGTGGYQQAINKLNNMKNNKQNKINHHNYPLVGGVI